MLKRRWPLLLLVVGLLVAGAIFLVPRSRVVDSVAVEKGQVEQSVVASGRVSTPARIAVSSQQAARIERVTVREGDRVRAGQLLVQLRSDEAEAALASARAALAEAQGRARQLSDVQRPVADQQLAQARASLRLAEQESVRARELHARQFVSQARVDEAERALAAARAAELAARAQAQANRDGGVERELARIRLAQARAQIDSAGARLELLALRAPADAVVLTRQAEPGDTAQVGRTLVELAQDGETRIIATVDEKNLRHLKAGLSASALADAFPARPFAAEVFYVAPAVDPQRGTVEVRLRVPQPPDFLRPDMTVSVEMRVGRSDDALRLTADALRGADAGAPWVLALRDGRAVRVPVRTGLTGVGTVEIAEGLQAGEVVILPGAQAEAGDRVRAKPRDPKRAKEGAVPVPGMAR